MKDTKFKRIQCIDRALDILEIASLGSCRTIGEMAEQVNLNMATAYNIVKTLMSRGYVEEAGGAYRLGETFRGMVQQEAAKESLPYRIRPLLREIARRLGNDHVSMATRVGDALETMTLMADSAGKYRNPYLNRTWDDPMYLAMGRVILAYESEATWMKAIEYHLDRGLPNPFESEMGHYELYKQLEGIRQKGDFAMMGREGDKSPFGAAAVPLFSTEGEILGAIGASCYAEEATQERLSVLVETIHAVIDAMWEHTKGEA